MTMIEVLTLAVVQGLTEFLPVSSSGHLVLAGSFFGAFTKDRLALIVVLHMATACGALLFYRRDIGRLLRDGFSARGDGESRRTLVLLVTATAVTALIGLAFQDFFQELFQSPASVGVCLALTGTVLFAASLRGPGIRSLPELTLWQAVLIGLAQGAAIVPGISRSGTTIAAALFLGTRREDAVRLSFLLLIPATAGAGLLEAGYILSMDSFHLLEFVSGFFAAALVGYLSIYLVLRWTGSGRLWYFGIYCWCAAAAATAAAFFL